MYIMDCSDWNCRLSTLHSVTEAWYITDLSVVLASIYLSVSGMEAWPV